MLTIVILSFLCWIPLLQADATSGTNESGLTFIPTVGFVWAAIGILLLYSFGGAIALHYATPTKQPQPESSEDETTNARSSELNV